MPVTIAREVNKRGGARAVASALNVARQTIYNYLNDERTPSKEFLKYLGLERIVIIKRSRKRKAKRNG